MTGDGWDEDWDLGPRPVYTNWLDEGIPPPTTQPYVQEELSRGGNILRRHPRIAKIVAGLAVAVLGVSVSVIASRGGDAPTPGDGTTILHLPDYRRSSIDSVSAEFGEVIPEACDSGEDTAVLIAAATDFYEGAFLSGLEGDEVTEADALAALDVALKNYNGAKANLTWHEFTPTQQAEYDRLKAGVEAGINNGKLIPLADYKAFLKDYLVPLGIEPVFDWSAMANAQKAFYAGQPDTKLAKPPANLDTLDARETMLGVADAISKTPGELAGLAPLENIYFGDMPLGVAGGVRASNGLFGYQPGTYMAIGVNDGYDSTRGEAGLKPHKDTVFHELTHSSNYENMLICLWDGKDSAWTAFNPTGFNYNPKLFNNNNGKTSRYETLDGDYQTGDSRLNVAPTGYALTALHEDNADSIALAFSDPTKFFDGTGAGKDGTIDNDTMFKKIAVWASGLPDSVRNYFEQRLALARVVGQLQSTGSSELTEALGKASEALDS